MNWMFLMGCWVYRISEKGENSLLEKSEPENIWHFCSVIDLKWLFDDQNCWFQLKTLTVLMTKWSWITKMNSTVCFSPNANESRVRHWFGAECSKNVEWNPLSPHIWFTVIIMPHVGKLHKPTSHCPWNVCVCKQSNVQSVNQADC